MAGVDGYEKRFLVMLDFIFEKRRTIIPNLSAVEHNKKRKLSATYRHEGIVRQSFLEKHIGFDFLDAPLMILEIGK